MPWLKRGVKKDRGDPIRVVMYSREGCHLCEEAWVLLAEMQGKFKLELEAVDVDTDAELVKHFGERVPVVMVNGKERFWGRISRVMLERLLEAGGGKK